MSLNSDATHFSRSPRVTTAVVLIETRKARETEKKENRRKLFPHGCNDLIIATAKAETWPARARLGYERSRSPLRTN
jgi:hypothetical protein